MSIRYFAIGQWHKPVDPKFTKIIEDNGFVLDALNPEFVFSFGGDGTFLDAVRSYYNKDVTFVGINLGKLGFYNNFLENELQNVIDLIKTSSYKTETFNLLDINANGNSYKAINELVILNPINTEIITVSIDNHKFEEYKGTGLLVCTPAGSTAYNKSLRGAILDTSIEAFELTEIAAINNKIYRSIDAPLVLSKNHKITFSIKDETATMAIDGVNMGQVGKKVDCQLSNDKIKVLIKEDSVFLDRVRKSFF